MPSYKIHRRKTLTAALVAVGLASGAAGLAVAADSQPSDVGAKVIAPTEQQAAYAKTIGGSGEPVSPASSTLTSMGRLASEHGVTLQTTGARTVRSPQGASDAEWTVAPTDAGGVCVAVKSSSLCGADAAIIAAGRAIVTEYPADRVISANPQQGTAIVEPSKEPGRAYGIAPLGATSVRVLGRDGKTLQQAPIDRGLYAVAVPAQGTPAEIAFSAGTKDVLSRPIP